MFFNYFKIASRALLKNKVYSLLNISGLAIGIAASSLILLFVSHEYSYDKFHTHSNSIYRVSGVIKWGENTINATAMSSLFGPKVKEASPDVVDYVRMRNPGKVMMQTDKDHRFYEQQFQFADPSLFSVFSFEIVKGSTTSLARPFTIIITPSIAKKYFGDTDPIGQLITYNNEYDFEVVGIVKQAPSNSSVQFDFVGAFNSMESMAEERSQFMHDRVSLGAYQTFFQIAPNADKANIEQVIASLVAQSADENYFLDPITSLHLGDTSQQDTNARTVIIFLSIALLILVLAIINYINLTTARGTTRAKEVGIRKTVGAQRHSLTIQFYFESALMTIIGFSLAIAFVEFFAPTFITHILQQDIDSSFITSPLYMGILAFLFFACILLAGSYPALFLSKFKPAEVLKGKLAGGTGTTWLRKSLTVFQFTVSVALIIGSMVVAKQLDFMQTREIGLTKENVVGITISGDMRANATTLMNQLSAQANVLSVAASTNALYREGFGGFFIKTPKTQEEIFMYLMSVNKQYFSTMEITWMQHLTDTLRQGDVVINEAALTDLQITKDDLGQKLTIGGTESVITGMVKDYNYTSLKNEIKGMLIYIEEDSTVFKYNGTMYVRLQKGASVKESIVTIKQLYETHKTAVPFEYYFLDEAFDTLYKNEQRLSSILQAFSGIAIFIACLGLLGLTTFHAERKAKEISIRKIIGASVKNITILLSTEFIILILISIAIASPLAWWGMDKWLTGFSYRIEIPLVFVAIAAGAILLITLLTISIQVLKAAFMNPVKALKNE